MNRTSYKLEERTLYVNLGPEIDHHHVTIINKELSNYLQLYMIKNIVFDFKNVTFMDSAGIGLLIGRSQMMEALGGKVIISHMSRRIQRVLELSGIEQYISLDKEEDR